jgi:creatinine amidohydrolase
MENFPWTRVPGVAMPPGAKPVVDYGRLQVSNPAEVRALVGDGNYHGRYQRPDDEMTALWQVAVEETRALIEHGWP